MVSNTWARQGAVLPLLEGVPAPGLPLPLPMHGLGLASWSAPSVFEFLPSLLAVWRRTPACGVILGGRGLRSCSDGGMKETARERGVEGEDCGRLTGASSVGLWERRSAGNVCKWEQALRAHIPSSSLSILLSFHSPSVWVIRKPYKSGLADNLPNWLNVAESLEC